MAEFLQDKNKNLNQILDPFGIKLNSESEMASLGPSPDIPSLSLVVVAVFAWGNGGDRGGLEKGWGRRV